MVVKIKGCSIKTATDNPIKHDLITSKSEK